MKIVGCKIIEIIYEKDGSTGIKLDTGRALYLDSNEVVDGDGF